MTAMTPNSENKQPDSRRRSNRLQANTAPFIPGKTLATKGKRGSTTDSDKKTSPQSPKRQKISEILSEKLTLNSTVDSPIPVSLAVPQVSREDSVLSSQASNTPADWNTGGAPTTNPQVKEWTLHWGNQFFPGMVISSPSHDPEIINGKALKDDWHTTETPFGAVYSKARKLIVVEVFENHCLTVPIFSHNKSGLQRQGSKDHFVAVRDNSVQATALSESIHPDLMFLRNPVYDSLRSGFHVSK